MYLPEQFREERPQVLRELIRRHPLATLVCMTSEGLTANHIPLVLASGEGEGGAATILRGHVARGNSVWRTLAQDSPVLAIFGGADHYITPSWYPAKQEHGKVVPTWNYAVVHAHGTIQFHDDKEQTRQYVTELTDSQESSKVHRWKVTDAPAAYLDSQLSGIVGFEVRVQRLTGKFKASQHRPAEERESVRRALEAEGVCAMDRDEIVRDPDSNATARLRT